MVFFTCSNCGSAIKKNQVAQHKFKCRNASVSCIDCGKDFWGNEYETHVRCISEAEKYCGKDYKPKENESKGQILRDKFTEYLENAAETSKLDPKVKALLQEIIIKPNVPRKQKQFENFVKNIFKSISPTLVSQLWEVVSNAVKQLKESRAKPSESKVKTEQKAESGVSVSESEKKSKKEKKKAGDDVEKEVTEAEDGEKKEKRKRKHKAEITDNENLEIKENVTEEIVDDSDKVKKRKSKKKEDDNQSSGLNETESCEKSKKRKFTGQEDDSKNKKVKEDLDADEKLEKANFKWKKQIIKILKESEGHELSFKKLKKTITSLYKSENSGEEMSKDEIEEIIKQKIESSSKIELQEKIVKLVN